MLTVNLDEEAELRGSAYWRDLKFSGVVFFLATYCNEQLLHLITDQFLLCLYAEEFVILTTLFL